MALLELRDASLTFGPRPILAGAELTIEPKERVCLVGRNGSGKSTLFSILTDRQALDDGVLRRRSGLTWAALAQEVPERGDKSVWATIAAGLPGQHELLERWYAASQTLGSADERALEAFGRLQQELEHSGAWEGSQRVDAVVTQLGLPPEARLDSLSGGMRRRAMLGQALVSEPDLLFLDEPTNHLDIDSVLALEQAVRDFAGTVLFITHDRAFIDALATRIVELDRGVLRSYPGSYAAYQARRAAELEAEAEERRQFDKVLAQEEAWIRQGIKARRTRNEGRVRRLESLRRERSARLERKGDVNLAVSSGERSGKLVLEAQGIGYGIGGRTLVRDFSLLVQRGDRIGLIGVNGSGKTTLLKLLLGELTPDAGSVRVGTNLAVAYFDQQRGQLDLDAAVRENVAPGTDEVEIDGKKRHVVSYLGDFLFTPEQLRAPTRTLSGGERNRLLLARLFTQPANLLVLDEPTNDLDVETLELLEALLADYDGTLMIVSHDRAFLDATVTSTLVLDGEGGVEEFVGGYSDWRRQAQSRGPSRSGGTNGKKAHSESVAPPPSATPTPKKRVKLSYKDQRELDALPERIETLETAHQAQLDLTLAPEFYRQDQETVKAEMQKLESLAADLAAAYERWETLEAQLEG